MAVCNWYEIPVHPCGRLHEAMQKNTYDWVVFTSPTGVRVFFTVRAHEDLDIRVLAGSKFAAIGSGTAGNWQEYGLRADLIPETYDAASLGKALAESCRSGGRILIPEPRQAAGS